MLALYRRERNPRSVWHIVPQLRKVLTTSMSPPGLLCGKVGKERLTTLQHLADVMGTKCWQAGWPPSLCAFASAKKAECSPRVSQCADQTSTFIERALWLLFMRQKNQGQHKVLLSNYTAESKNKNRMTQGLREETGRPKGHTCLQKMEGNPMKIKSINRSNVFRTFLYLSELRELTSAFLSLLQGRSMFKHQHGV